MMLIVPGDEVATVMPAYPNRWRVVLSDGRVRASAWGIAVGAVGASGGGPTRLLSPAPKDCAAMMMPGLAFSRSSLRLQPQHFYALFTWIGRIAE